METVLPTAGAAALDAPGSGTPAQTRRSRQAAALISRGLRKRIIRGPAMAHIEESPRKCILKAGSTTLTLDKESGKATLQQKVLLWNRKPVEFDLADIDDIAVKSEKDGLSGAAIHHSVLHRRTGEITVLTTEEAKDATETMRKLRGFIGLG